MYGDIGTEPTGTVIVYCDIETGPADIVIVRGGIETELADIAIVPADNVIKPVDIVLVPANIGVELTDIAIGYADTGAEPIDIVLVYAGIGFLPTDIGLLPTDIGSVPTDIVTEPGDIAFEPIGTGIRPAGAATEVAGIGVESTDTWTEPRLTGWSCRFGEIRPWEVTFGRSGPHAVERGITVEATGMAVRTWVPGREIRGGGAPVRWLGSQSIPISLRARSTKGRITAISPRTHGASRPALVREVTAKRLPGMEIRPPSPGQGQYVI
ncbi:MAG: hypothetical protein AB7S39_21355 [Gemmatimonadales bacterium]